MEHKLAGSAEHGGITIESPFDKAVKWLSVYLIGGLALFLLVKEHIFGRYYYIIQLVIYNEMRNT